MVVILYCRIIVLFQQSLLDHFPDGLMGKIRIDCTGSISKKGSKVMDLSWLS